MIETFRDLKHGRSAEKTYNDLSHEHSTKEILHHLEAKESEEVLDSLRSRVLSNAHTIYGPTRTLDIVTYSLTSSRRTVASIVEHSPTGRSYIHCSSARESSRTAAIEHLLVITEDLLARMVDAQGIESCGWLPLSAPGAAAANSIAAANSAAGSGSTVASSLAGSLPGSRRGSVQPQQMQMMTPVPGMGGMGGVGLMSSPMTLGPRNGESPPEGYGISPGMALVRRSSDQAMRRAGDPSAQPGQWKRSNGELAQQQQVGAVMPRTKSDIILQPKPVPGGRGVRWDMGSES
ncbi:uncharacterized protein BDZ99DRAFT_540327 [Mytilinidion resinicola]|uniref:Uncharacterized protein n=1 Tax=Mytilinidion resinicola TaxID=574789 RepID=A0A6A6YAU9_9PEZI|nr:uncharacterized protein BDZ99DRAFT_540327 [Mytilinidion resinicola]KAF2805698.1 hypothetical protein BDZ99DRAFT_540327 [Mytilinidion resinicola]